MTFQDKPVLRQIYRIDRCARKCQRRITLRSAMSTTSEPRLKTGEGRLKHGSFSIEISGCAGSALSGHQQTGLSLRGRTAPVGNRNARPVVSFRMTRRFERRWYVAEVKPRNKLHICRLFARSVAVMIGVTANTGRPWGPGPGVSRVRKSVSIVMAAPLPCSGIKGISFIRREASGSAQLSSPITFSSRSQVSSMA